MLTALPIHIWDREIESRIFLSAISLINGSDVVLGHEYNITPIYKQVNNIFHYGAGRPINVKPRTDQWYEQIVKRNGHVGLVYEEGINDIFSPIAADSFVGIDKRSIEALSMQYGWCKEEIELMGSTIKDKETKNLFISKSMIVGNPRFELQGAIGRKYFEDITNSIKNMFGNYILISDNFGATKAFGHNSPISISRDIGQVASKDKAKKIESRYLEAIEEINDSKKAFINIINDVVEKFPDITFIFRPHPLADCSQWYESLIKARNLIILMRDSIEPYIFGSLCMIHAGCTTGVQSELSSVDTIDITDMFNDRRAKAASSIMATHKPNNKSELYSVIGELVRKEKAIKYKIGKASLEEKLHSNIKTLKIRRLNSCLAGKITYPEKSSLYQLHMDIGRFRDGLENMQSKKEVNIIYENVLKYNPNPIKGRNYTLQDIRSRLRRAIICLDRENFHFEISINRIAPNTFFIRRRD